MFGSPLIYLRNFCPHFRGCIVAALSIARPFVFVPAINLASEAVSPCGAVSPCAASRRSTNVCPGPGPGSSPPSLGTGPVLSGEDLACAAIGVCYATMAVAQAGCPVVQALFCVLIHLSPCCHRR